MRLWRSISCQIYPWAISPNGRAGTTNRAICYRFNTDVGAFDGGCGISSMSPLIGENFEGYQNIASVVLCQWRGCDWLGSKVSITRKGTDHSQLIAKHYLRLDSRIRHLSQIYATLAVPSRLSQVIRNPWTGLSLTVLSLKHERA